MVSAFTAITEKPNVRGLITDTAAVKDTADRAKQDSARRAADADELVMQQTAAVRPVAHEVNADRRAQKDADERAVSLRRMRIEHDKLAAELEGQWMETLPEIRTCTICQDKIAGGESVLLPACLHAICRKDAVHLLQQKGAITCTICNIKSTITGTPPPTHPLVETALVREDVPFCKKCFDDYADTAVPATFACTACDWNLCDGHASTHLSLPKFKAHALVPLPSSIASAPRCPIHGEPVLAYCGSCKVVICKNCFASTHPPGPAHPSVLLDAPFVQTTRQRLVTGVQAARALATEHVNRAADARVTHIDIATRDHQIDSKIAETFSVLRNLLDRREQTLRQQLRDATAAEQRVLRESEAADGLSWRVVTSVANIADIMASQEVLGASAPSVLAQLEPVATARLQALVTGAPTNGVPFPAPLHFRTKNVDAVTAVIQSVGELSLAPGSI